MSLGTRLLRIGAGLLALVATLYLSFAIIMSRMPTWGATPEEAAQALPGDEILSAPMVDWTNARTIQAPPNEVWPWLAQIGDTRGGFYSFTFIEDRVGSLTGGSGYTVDYANANGILSEWQNPQPGDEIIQGTLRWEQFGQGQWLLANSTNPDVMGWTWLWRIAPTPDGQGTRLVNRIRIQAMAGIENPVVSFFVGNGAFIMEQRMMNGIKAHAEGWVEPSYQEAVEIGLWFIALLAGITGAVLFVARRAWIAPLALAIASVVVIVVLTFVQPAIAWRVVCDLVLVGGLWLAGRTAKGQSQPKTAGAVGTRASGSR